MHPLVTVVIPTCLRHAKLRNCLLALAQQKLSPSQFEIIVVDQANDRATAKVVKETANQMGLSVRYVSQRRDRNEAAACNRGWRLANSLFIAFTHDDCLPQPLWLTTALPLFHNGAQVIIGRVQYPVPNHPIVASAGANLFCRRTLLEQVGGFDEWLDMKQSHEDNWLDRLGRAEVPIIACPDAVVIRPVRESAWIAALRITLSKLF